MAESKNPFRNIRVETRKSPRTLKILLVILIVFCTVTLAALGWVRSAIENQTDDLRDKAAALEQENEDLQRKTDLVDSVEGVQEIARDELGLVDPDTILITPTQP